MDQQGPKNGSNRAKTSFFCKHNTFFCGYCVIAKHSFSEEIILNEARPRGSPTISFALLWCNVCPIVEVFYCQYQQQHQHQHRYHYEIQTLVSTSALTMTSSLSTGLVLSTKPPQTVAVANTFRTSQKQIWVKPSSFYPSSKSFR